MEIDNMDEPQQKFDELQPIHVQLCLLFIAILEVLRCI